ncbi:hypothetical protein CO015_04835 [candidate division WWE3 bacterium CG_4_8_14_3_um_filter_42_11]|uniref:Transcriptional regulator n=2 Tax=Katanobacteria TaxID=422282 RepID=A0A2M7TCQ0_UNCKA|nr:MAG: hypothetical protein COY34_01510 [candidate division WWE3 bacterium CG_4_10_14_0_2_um_filter_42_8]PJC68207.1 MAG: hypothetical protein CO015_04835 [candidate division WWE3 bacterium CG_4_8_14_3_um_filter_42_11]
MNQVSKLQQLQNLSYFGKSTLSQYMDLSDNSLYANIKRWQKRGELIQLKKGFYVTAEFYKKLPNKEIYLEFISNKLKEPSYLSLEYVLQKYGVVSEAIYSFTSVTLKSRGTFINKLGTFLYRHLKENLFSGYQLKELGGFTIKEATKSKALFDYLYFRNFRNQIIDKETLRSYRLNLDELKQKDFQEFSTYCEMTKVKKYQNLLNLLKEAYAL